ncbi:MAG: extracellular solute-binding protein [Alphaproteobacteria bacterium]|nr:extracellular solute-binding protein [Alphaproteobacteria bacterium]
MTKINETMATLAAAQLSRRSVLKAATALGAVGFASPIFVKNAFSSSGELNHMGWAGYNAYKDSIDAFTKKTGIKVNLTEQPDNETIFAQAKLAAQTGGFDTIEPTVDRTTAYVENGLVQAWDEKKVNLGNYLPGMVDGSAGTMAVVKGGRYFVPAVWGTEALVFNKAKMPLEYGKASLADLFAANMDGKVTIRAHSSLASLGRVMDAAGKLPKPFMDGYKDEATFREIWDVILKEALTHKKNVVQFWKGENEAQAAFRTNGAIIGQCWDSTGFNLSKEGYGYIAPKEGAIAWNQGYMMMKNAKNVEQAYEWLNFQNTPEGGAAMAKVYSANPVGKGAVDLMDKANADFYNAAFPADALSKLWWWPAQNSAILKARAEYADKFIAG